MSAMDPHSRAESVWYRIAGLISRKQKDLAVSIIEAEIRSAMHEILLEADGLAVSGTSGPNVARALRERAEQTIRPTGDAT